MKARAVQLEPGEMPSHCCGACLLCPMLKKSLKQPLVMCTDCCMPQEGPSFSMKQRKVNASASRKCMTCTQSAIKARSQALPGSPCTKTKQSRAVFIELPGQAGSMPLNQNKHGALEAQEYKTTGLTLSKPIWDLDQSELYGGLNGS